jgi:acyl-CoA hydrolase
MMTGMTIDQAAEWIARTAGPGGRVHVGGCAGEPVALYDAFARRPELAAGLTFFGVWIPGVNRCDWGALHPDARAETIFASPDWTDGMDRGRTRVVPETYSTTWRRYEATGADVSVLMIPPLRRPDRFCYGMAADFGPATFFRAPARLLLTNAAMPAAVGGLKDRVTADTAMAEADHPLTTLPAAPLDPAFTRIAGHVRGLLRDGDTIQFGLGKVQAAVIPTLTDLRDLRIHSGMISDPLLDLLGTPTLENAGGAVVTGVALCSGDAAYRTVARSTTVTFAPVGHTHDIRTLARINNLVAVNSVIEVDLFGQANAEFLGGRAVSGGGGMLDFLRGANLSEGGRPIVALASTAKGGSLSRIVPRLADGAVTVPRADMGIVVTEHGSADLRGLDGEARAMALIGIADPAHRADLADAWRRIRRAGS